MLRVLSVVLCILVVCLSLCACGAKNDAEEIATEAMSEVADTENGTVSDGDGYIGNEATTETVESSSGNNNGNNDNNNDDNDSSRMFGNNNDIQDSTDTFM